MTKQKDWEKEWREKYDIGSWVAPNGKRYPYSEIYGFIQSLLTQQEIEMDEKGTNTKNGSKVLGIQVKCPDHGWQRTIHIKDGIGCSKCYGNKKL